MMEQLGILMVGMLRAISQILKEVHFVQKNL